MTKELEQSDENRCEKYNTKKLQLNVLTKIPKTLNRVW